MQMQQPEHKKLEIFVGKWNTVGLIKETAENPAVRMTGTDTYEWLPGNYVLLHKVDVSFGIERKQSMEVIGYDTSSGTYRMHYFDPEGNSGSMEAREQNGSWIFLSQSLRFSGKFSEDGKTLSGIWERSSNGVSWMHWMDIKLTKLIEGRDQ